MLNNILSTRDKYNSDPHFKTLVDHMFYWINQGEFDPTEIRQASILAHIMYSEINAVPINMNQTLKQFLKDES